MGNEGNEGRSRRELSGSVGGEERRVKGGARIERERNGEREKEEEALQN